LKYQKGGVLKVHAGKRIDNNIVLAVGTFGFISGLRHGIKHSGKWCLQYSKTQMLLGLSMGCQMNARSRYWLIFDLILEGMKSLILFHASPFNSGW
jgi:hypothetical protein